jgi:protein-tyrosine-phosphatase
MDKTVSVMFVCTGSSALSQMAGGWVLALLPELLGKRSPASKSGASK